MLLLARAVELDRELRATRDELDRVRQELAATRKRLALLQESHNADRAQIAYIHEQLQQARKELIYERGRDRLTDAIRIAGYYGDDRGGVG
jgi:septal ring factor EnvC (AmiA/AmiB activator)